MFLYRHQNLINKSLEKEKINRNEKTDKKSPQGFSLFGNHHPERQIHEVLTTSLGVKQRILRNLYDIF